MRHSSPARQLSLTVASIASAEEARTNGGKGAMMQLKNRRRLLVWPRLAALIGIMFLLFDFAPARSQAQNHPDARDLGETARQATIAIFQGDRKSTRLNSS